MADRLDRIEAVCDRNAEAVKVNTEAIKVLIDVTQTVSQRTVAITEMMQSVESHRQEVTDRLSQAIADGESRFETMLAEARADRIEWRRHIEAQNQMIQGLLVQMATTNSRIDQLEGS